MKTLWLSTGTFTNIPTSVFSIAKYISAYSYIEDREDHLRFNTPDFSNIKDIDNFFTDYDPKKKNINVGINFTNTLTDDTKEFPSLLGYNLIYTAALISYHNDIENREYYSNLGSFAIRRKEYLWEYVNSVERVAYSKKNEKICEKVLQRFSWDKNDITSAMNYLDEGNIIILDNDYTDIENRKEKIKAYVLDERKKHTLEKGILKGTYKEVVFDTPLNMLAKMNELHSFIEDKNRYTVIVDILNKIGLGGEIPFRYRHKHYCIRVGEATALNNLKDLKSKELKERIKERFVSAKDLWMLKKDNNVNGMYFFVAGDSLDEVVDACDLINENLRRNSTSPFYQAYEMKFSGSFWGLNVVLNGEEMSFSDLSLDNDCLYVISYKQTAEKICDCFNARAIEKLIEKMRYLRQDYKVIIAGERNEINNLINGSDKIKYFFSDGLFQIKENNEESIYQDVLASLPEELKGQEELVKEYIKQLSNEERIDSKLLQRKISRSLMLKQNLKTEIKEADKYVGYQEMLENIIGLEGFKKELKEFQYFTKYLGNEKNSELRKGRNFHMLFLGNAGTGKTSCARLMSKMLYENGILKKDKFIEASRSDLVGMYVGHTAQKTKSLIKKAMGGVLFIDEAYSLCLDERDSFGQEAIATLIKEMEDHRDELVVIMAGYDREMEKFVDYNSGMKSRIAYKFHFDDYSEEELTQIFELKAKKENLSLSLEAREKVKEIMAYFKTNPDFGNGRFAERVFQYCQNIYAKNCCINKNYDSGILNIEDIVDIEEILSKNGQAIDQFDYRDADYEARVAVHEAGHLLCASAIGDDSYDCISIKSVGNIGGYVKHKSSVSYTYKHFCNKLTTLLGGMVAENIVTGEHSSGCYDDLAKAKDLAKAMVEDYGMPSLDAKPLDLVKRAQQLAQKILSDNSDTIIELAKLLINNKELNKEEIDNFFKENELVRYNLSPADFAEC